MLINKNIQIPLVGIPRYIMFYVLSSELYKNIS